MNRKMSRILIIDDDDIFREIASTLLRENDYEVVTLAEASNIIDEINRIQPDILITDILMPETDGIEVIMSTRKSFPDLPVIAISSGGRINSKDYLNMARKLGASAIVQKSKIESELVSEIKKLLE